MFYLFKECTVLQYYHEAMKCQLDGLLDKAQLLYTEILQSEIIMNNDSTGSSTLMKVKFLILKNLATIAKEKNDLSTAVATYIEVPEEVMVCVLLLLK
jgi:hypothetical protein